jgi:hypothetical protein
MIGSDDDDDDDFLPSELAKREMRSDIVYFDQIIKYDFKFTWITLNLSCVFSVLHTSKNTLRKVAILIRLHSFIYLFIL